MKLIWYEGHNPNFGDALNPWIWPRLLPDFFDEDAETVFMGIGSIIGLHDFPASVRKIVFGAAYVPEYGRHRVVLSENWDVYCVRGLRTARLMGLDPRVTMGDSAVLLASLVSDRPRTPRDISFIPHWRSFDSGHWDLVCARAGVRLIDPRAPIETILAGILESKMILTEALHGAVVADALRVPFLPLVPLKPMHRAKWHEWGEGMGLDVPRLSHRLFPSSLGESLSVVHGHLMRLKSPPAPAHSGCVRRRPPPPASGKGLWHESFIEQAAAHLRILTRKDPVLSSDSRLHTTLESLHEALHRLKRSYG